MNILVGVISPAPAWILPRQFVDQIRRAFPQHTVSEAWDRDAVRRLLPQADAAFTPFVDRDIFPSASRLKSRQRPIHRERRRRTMLRSQTTRRVSGRGCDFSPRSNPRTCNRSDSHRAHAERSAPAVRLQWLHPSNSSSTGRVGFRPIHFVSVTSLRFRVCFASICLSRNQKCFPRRERSSERLENP